MAGRLPGGRGLALLGLCGALLGTCALPGSDDRQPPPSEAVPPRAATPDEAAPEDPEARRLADMKARCWWHLEVVIEGLGLSEQQRAVMDQALEAHYRDRAEGQAERLALPEAVSQALEEGDWEEARRLSQLVGEASAELASSFVELKIQVLSHLTPAQRQRLADEFPRILTARWMRGDRVLRLKKLRAREAEPD